MVAAGKVELSNCCGGGPERSLLGIKVRGSNPKFLTYWSEEKVFENVSMFAPKGESESILILMFVLMGLYYIDIESCCLRDIQGPEHPRFLF